MNYQNLSVTGDPDQSIYGWRGAKFSNILDFEKDYPDVKIVRLEQNYRSTKRILRVADDLIANNKRRKAKRLFTDNDEGAPVSLTRYQSHSNTKPKRSRRRSVQACKMAVNHVIMLYFIASMPCRVHWN